MRIGRLTMCSDVSNCFVPFTLLQFCKKCSILSFCERAVDFFDS